MKQNNKIVDWVNNSGEVVFKAKNGFTRSAESKLQTRYGKRGSHMRIGRFSVILVKDGWDMVVGPIYNQHIVDEEGFDVRRNSQYWDAHMRNRTLQLNTVRKALVMSHPYYDEILEDIEKEFDYFS
jgi:hypothetical protein